MNAVLALTLTVMEALRCSSQVILKQGGTFKEINNFKFAWKHLSLKGNSLTSLLSTSVIDGWERILMLQTYLMDSSIIFFCY